MFSDDFMPRQPILSVLGHVNAGKTSFLDAIRESRITDGEAGQITQMIGATEVPLDTLEEVCGNLLEQLETDIEIPGIMFIDTPGHAAFSSLRKRGGSISDIGILMVDVEEGVQPQTEEAIEILKNSGTPFIVALNKIDKVSGWRNVSELFSESMPQQQDHVQQEVDRKIYELMGDLNDYGLVSDRFDRVDNFQEKIAIVPISAETHMGIPELLMVVTGLSQNYLSEELDIEEGIGKGTVLEVTQEKGMGTTADVILYDGIMRDTDKLVYGTSDGVKETEIRSLLQPRPLREIREDKHYSETDKVTPAAGVKIAAKDFEGVISGAPVRSASEQDLEQAREEVEDELEAVQYDTTAHGVVVKADSLGSLEALMTEIENKDIQVQKAEVGPVNKSDVVKAEDEEDEYRAIFAFNVGVTDQASESLENSQANLFQSKIIYEILDGYTEWKQELKEKQRKRKLESISRPAKIRLMPDHVFRSSNPAVVGTEIIDGVLSSGSKIMNEDGDVIGSVKSIQEQNESVDKAVKGDEVAVSISGATVGRNVEEGEILLSDINSTDYSILKELDDMLSAGEKHVLDQIVELKDSKNPHWKLG